MLFLAALWLEALLAFSQAPLALFPVRPEAVPALRGVIGGVLLITAIFWLRPWAQGAFLRGLPLWARGAIGQFSTIWLLVGGSAASLALVEFFAFTVPNTRWFFWGLDDARTVVLALSPNPIVAGQDTLGRPFLLIAHWLGFLLTPQSFDGWFLESSFFRFATSLFLALAVLVVRPCSRMLAVVAAVMYVVSPADDLRFWVTTVGYSFAVCLLVLGILFFLWSFRTGSRAILLLGCVALVVSLGTYEGGYAPAAAIPLLLPLVSQARAPWLAWCFGWFGALGLMALRLATLILSGSTYQGAVASTITSPADLASAALRLLEPTLRYLGGFSIDWGMPIAVHWEIVALAGCSTLALLACATPGRPAPSQIRQSLAAMGIAAGFVALSVAAFLPIANAQRTQFFAAPAQALLWASLVLLVVSIVPLRARTALATGIVVLLSSGATAYNLTYADFLTKVHPQQFNKMSFVFEQVAPLTAKAPADVVILYQVEDPRHSPFGVASGAVNYSTRLSLGLDGFQANIVDFPKSPFCDASGCMVFDPNTPERHVDFDHLIVVLVSNSALVRLAKEIPPALLPPGTSAAGYAPERFAGAPRPGPLPYFHLSWWMVPYQPPPSPVP